MVRTLSKPSEDFAPVTQTLLSFVEKPTCEAAASLLKGGMHLESGIFLFLTSTILDLFAQYAPEILSNVTDALRAAETDLDHASRRKSLVAC